MERAMRHRPELDGERSGTGRPTGRRRGGMLAAGLTLALGAAVLGAGGAGAAPGRPDMPSSVPVASTPAINNGQVHALARVGSAMVIGGTFTSVSQPGTTAPVGRTRIAAFDAASGTVSSFNPNVNGSVEAVAAGPMPGTVYIGGTFTSVNGVSANRVALLALNTGQLVPGFSIATGFNGPVNDIVLSDGHLFVGGMFSKYRGTKHSGIASLNPTTGAVDPYMNVQMAGQHNDTGAGRHERTGARDVDISPDGRTMAVIGNFRTIDGYQRTQLALLDLGPTSASVRPSFRTSDYEALCYSNAFDTTVRKVSFDPSGAYFVVTATGGGNDSLCDTAARWEADGTGQDLHPTWVSSAGGDTLYGLAISDRAVFVGGHQRWMNNPLGNDSPGAGAVPRPGLAALDPATGIPLSWNPGRNPRGAGAYTLLATEEGLWVGSDTPFIGNRKYKRPRIAFFPFTGGTDLPSTNAPQLAALRVAGTSTGGTTNVLYRVNAGGSALGAGDNGPDWSSDDGGNNPVRNSGSNSAGYEPGTVLTPSVPAGTPAALFDSERWDPDGGAEMAWHFPVAAGKQVAVRLYFANRCSCTDQRDARIFDVDVEGATVLDNYDIVRDVNSGRGTMKSFAVTSDGSIDIDFGHVVENPLINAIEILDTAVTPVPPTQSDAVTQTVFDGATLGSTSSVPTGGVVWRDTRGAFVAGGVLFYVKTDGLFYRRTVSGSTYGPEQKLDPYHDPAWATISNGSGGVYNGSSPTLAGQMPALTGLFYDSSRIYYTLSGDAALHYRSFSVDSGIVSPKQSNAPSSVSFAGVRGVTKSGGKIYFVDLASGRLLSATFTNGAVTGTTTELDDPALSGRNWVGRSLFVAPN